MQQFLLSSLPRAIGRKRRRTISSCLLFRKDIPNTPVVRNYNSNNSFHSTAARTAAVGTQTKNRRLSKQQQPRKHYFSSIFQTAASTVASAVTTNSSTTTQSHSIQNHKLDGVHPLHLFRIVQDVDSYQDFLPLCSHSHVWKDTIHNHGKSYQADLVVGFGSDSSSWFGKTSSSLFQTSYTSNVKVDPERLMISTTSGRGVAVSSEDNNNNDNTANHATNNTMFDSLSSVWKLKPLVERQQQSSTTNKPIIVSTLVDFKVQMTVSDPIVAAFLDKVLKHVAETQIQAFSDRCQVIPPPTPEELQQAEDFFKVLGKP